jgi:hypothetical protein
MDKVRKKGCERNLIGRAMPAKTIEHDHGPVPHLRQSGREVAVISSYLLPFFSLIATNGWLFMR